MHCITTRVLGRPTTIDLHNLPIRDTLAHLLDGEQLSEAMTALGIDVAPGEGRHSLLVKLGVHQAELRE